MAPSIGVRCDASAAMGVGHLIRCLALADELQRRGAEVVMLSTIEGLPWLSEQVREAHLTVCAPLSAPADLVAQAHDLGLAAVVLDGYHLDAGAGRALRQAGITVLAVVDGPFGADQEADLYLDQNLGASALPGLPAGSRMLAGLEYALFREQVTRRRPSLAAQPVPEGRPVRVLAVFGGTDAFAAAPVVVPLLLSTGAPLHVVAVAARPATAAELRGLPLADGQTLEVVAPVADLAGLAVGCDAAVSAAGSSVWEMLCLGVPLALVCVVDNQEVGYRRVVSEDVVAPLGRLADLRHSGPARRVAVESLRRLVSDAAHRARMRRRGMELVDGRGRERVADALLALLPRGA